MNRLADYFRTVRTDPTRVWFRRKRYGWGWTPARWQGWLLLIIYTACVSMIMAQLDVAATADAALARVTLPMLGITAILVLVCYLTGEKPRWQWGREESR